MNPRTFFGLAAATVLFGAAAIGTAAWNDAPAKVAAADGHVFPQLAEDPNAVARIYIESSEGTFSLVRGDAGWTAPDKHNYRADSDDVRKLIVGLADMRFVGAKTAKPELYERLDVDDVSPDGASRFVRVEGESGKVLAEAIIGKRRYQLTGDQRQGTYLRMPGEAQSWLVTGGVGVEEQLTDWLDRQIIDFAADDIRRVEIKPVAGKPYAITRDSKDADFTLQAVLADRSVKQNERFTRLTSALSSLRFDDVRPAKPGLFVAPATATFETFGGLEITARVMEEDGVHWARFALDVQPPMAMPDEHAEQAEHLKSWQFALPEFAAEKFSIPLDDWLEAGDGTS